MIKYYDLSKLKSNRRYKIKILPRYSGITFALSKNRKVIRKYD